MSGEVVKKPVKKAPAKKAPAKKAAPAEAVDQSRIDEMIWEYSGIKPVREISELTGLKPEEVMRRKTELIDSVDVLSIQQKRQRLLIELDGMARDARERAANTIDEYYSGMLNSSVAAIKTLLNELSRMEKQDSGKVEALNRKRVEELVSLVREVVDESVAEISETYGLDDQELFSIFNQRMIDAAQKRDMA